MVLAISTCAPDVPAVAVGALESLLWEPQPASPSAQTAIAAPATKEWVRMSGGYPIDTVRHAQFTAAVPHDRGAALVEDGLIVAVHDDILPDVVGDDDVGRTLHRDRPAGTQRVDRVTRSIDVQRRLVAVQRLHDALTRDVGVAIVRLGCGHSDAYRHREGDRARRQP